MPRAVERKEYPLSMRLLETDIAVIDRGCSTARPFAHRLHARRRRAGGRRCADGDGPIRMSPAGFNAFMAALSGPATAGNDSNCSNAGVQSRKAEA